MKWVECVPNVSEGRDRATLDAIAGAVAACEGVRLLDVDAGAATHRTVFTFVGPMEAVGEAAFRLVECAARRIDMRRHSGAHPRLGATDVVPFVPLQGATMEECVALSKAVGERIGRELGIPVYLYERAASTPERESLADIRRGEYEGLEAKLRDPRWKPDFGPAALNAAAGATVVGARPFLIAWNVNLNTRDRKLATAIAQNIRETGRPRRDAGGKVLKDAAGKTLTEPGPSRLERVRATGWYIEEYGRAQVSINLTDFRTTPIHAAFEAVTKEAAALGLRVTGSELVGLVPLEAILAAGRHYLEAQGKSPAANRDELIRMAALSLGLSEVAPFDPAQKIIELRVQPEAPLASRSVAGFVDEVASPAPAPGGGSVAALAGSLAAGLAAMVTALTHDARGFETRRAAMAAAGEEAQRLKARLLAAVDEDSRAFDDLLSAMRRPRGTEAEVALRDAAVREATMRAIEVPLSVMRDALEVLRLAGAAASGLPSAASDAGVSALLAHAALEGAGMNVAINLKGLSDPEHARRIAAEASRLRESGLSLREAALAAIEGSTQGPGGAQDRSSPRK